MTKLFVLNDTTNNALSKFIPQKRVNCDDRNPLLFNNELENLIKKKNIIYKLNISNDKCTGKLETIKSL